MSRNDFLEEIAGYICEYAPKYDILCPSAVIAQAILESGWGESTLAAKYHNYFGMKCGTLWQGKSVNMKTQEEYTPGELTTITDNFRVYDSMEDGVIGYFEFIQMPRYQNLKGIKDPAEYLETISADGYATSSAYVENCMRVVTENNLMKYDPMDSDQGVYAVRRNAVDWMVDLCTDDSHGYSQEYRWGEEGDYDCSSAIIEAYQTAGVPVKEKGATYTGNMRKVFLANGFKDVTGDVNLVTGAGMIPGDVLLNEAHHTAMYIGDGQEAEASINEKGTATGGTPGDQTGKEILVRSYRNYPWDCVLRFQGEKKPIKTKSCTVTKPYLSKGDMGDAVKRLQFDLNLLTGAKLDVDGEFGPATDKALRAYQKSKGIEASGLCGTGTHRRIERDYASRTHSGD